MTDGVSDGLRPPDDWCFTCKTRHDPCPRDTQPMAQRAVEINKLRQELDEHRQLLDAEINSARKMNSYDNGAYIGRLKGQRDMAQYVISKLKKIQKLPKDG